MIVPHYYFCEVEAGMRKERFGMKMARATREDIDTVTIFLAKLEAGKQKAASEFAMRNLPSLRRVIWGFHTIDFNEIIDHRCEHLRLNSRKVVERDRMIRVVRRLRERSVAKE